MKWLKLYEDFNEDSIIKDLEDICVELNDDGITTQCEHNVPSTKYAPLVGQREHISVQLEKTNSDYNEYTEDLKWVDIHDVILRVLEFMDSNGWKPSYFIFDGEVNHTEFFSFDKIIDWLNFKTMLSVILSSLKIDFIRK